MVLKANLSFEITGSMPRNVIISSNSFEYKVKSDGPTCYFEVDTLEEVSGYKIEFSRIDTNPTGSSSTKHEYELELTSNNTISNLVLYPSGYFAITSSNSESELIPLTLYGWTVSGTRNNFKINGSNKVYTDNFYTDTATPTVSSKLYTRKGLEITQLSGSTADDSSSSGGIGMIIMPLLSTGYWHSSDGLTSASESSISFTLTDEINVDSGGSTN